MMMMMMISFVISIWGVPNRDIIFAPQIFFCTVWTHCYYNQIDISFSGGPSQSQPSERTHDLACAREGEMCSVGVSHKSHTGHTRHHSHAIWMKSRVRGAFIWLALFGIEIQFHAPVFVPEQHKISNSNSISTKNHFGWYFQMQVGSWTGPNW